MVFRSCSACMHSHSANVAKFGRARGVPNTVRGCIGALGTRAVRMKSARQARAGALVGLLGPAWGWGDNQGSSGPRGAGGITNAPRARVGLGR